MQVKQTAPFGFCGPFFAIAVAVENNTLMGSDFTLYQCGKCFIKIRSGFQFLSKLPEFFGNRSIQHNIWTGNIKSRTQHTEFKLIAGKRKGRSTVAVSAVLGDIRQDRSADIHHRAGDIGIIRARNDGFQNGFQLIADKHRNNRWRRFIRAQTVVIARVRNRNAQ